MEMLLTRMGPSSKIVVTGDITQIDLPYTLSGLLDAMKVLSRVDDIHFHYFEEDDVVRHELVKNVLRHIVELKKVDGVRLVAS